MKRRERKALKASALAALFLAASVAGAVAAPAAGSVGGSAASLSALHLPANGAAITFGRSSGIVAGFCSQGPAVAPAYSVSLFANGRVISSGVAGTYSPPHPTSTIVQRLIQRARRDHFFHMPAHITDTPCRGAATTYVRVRGGGKTHTVEVYGYLDSPYPALADLVRALQTAVGV